MYQGKECTNGMSFHGKCCFTDQVSTSFITNHSLLHRWSRPSTDLRENTRCQDLLARALPGNFFFTCLCQALDFGKWARAHCCFDPPPVRVEQLALVPAIVVAHNWALFGAVVSISWLCALLSLASFWPLSSSAVVYFAQSQVCTTRCSGLPC